MAKILSRAAGKQSFESYNSCKTKRVHRDLQLLFLSVPFFTLRRLAGVDRQGVPGQRPKNAPHSFSRSADSARFLPGHPAACEQGAGKAPSDQCANADFIAMQTALAVCIWISRISRRCEMWCSEPDAGRVLPIICMACRSKQASPSGGCRLSL